jgi:Protein of unknown function (DUF2637)
MTAGADRWIRGTTVVSVALLALIAGTVSYLHMHALVARHGQPGWVAALTPFSVDGMIVAASTTLLADSRTGRRGGFLPWALLVAGSVASLAANVAVAEPTLIGRVIAAWPSFALTASDELLTRQVRRSSASTDSPGRQPQRPRTVPAPPAKPAPVSELRLVRPPELGRGTAHQALICGRVPGSGHWPTVLPMAACPAAAQSALPTVATNGGDAWSRTQASQNPLCVIKRLRWSFWRRVGWPSGAVASPAGVGPRPSPWPSTAVASPRLQAVICVAQAGLRNAHT